MDPLVGVLNRLVPLSLVAATFLYLLQFLRGPESGSWRVRLSLHTALGLQLISFAVFVTVWGRLPLASPGEAFGTIALAITVVYALLEVLLKERSTGFLFLAIATVFSFCRVLGAPPGPEVNEILRQTWFGIHAISAVMGYTAFAVSAVYGILFVLLYRDLKNRRFGLMYDRVPPLESLSHTSTVSAALGLGFLTLAIVVGAFGWAKTLDHPAMRDSKVVSSLVVWAVYGISLGLRRSPHWSGIRSIGLNLVAFALMVISSWLIPILLPTAHDVKELL